eukprot:gene9272-16965_t
MKNSDSVAPPSEEVPSKDAKEEDKSAKKDNKQVSKPKKKSKDDFKFIKILGEGSYSTVYLVEEIASSKQFAMKVLEKRHIIKEKKVPYVSREKEALAMTNHPFILGSFNEECTQFYSAEIIVALEYLHSLGIIHRDLKPENVLFGENMHILITDFGTSKLLKKDKTKASSFVGTAEYVSPELLTDKIAYKSNEYQTFQRIIKLEYEFPEGFPECPKELVQKLLVLDPAKRIGCEELGGFPELKAHPFFKGIEWDTLPEQQPPKLLPYLPSKSADCEDLGSNYDISVSSDEDEELMNDMFNDLLIKNITNDVREKSSSVSSSQASSTSSSSKDSPWQQFVGNRPILKEGLVDKRKGLFAKRRQLILTEGPHLFYVDPHAMVLKGEIPWTKDLRPEAKSFKIFFVHTCNSMEGLEESTGEGAAKVGGNASLTWAQMICVAEKNTCLRRIIDTKRT